MALHVREIMRYDGKQATILPLYTASIRAGFPSPAEEHIEKNLNLNELLIRNPAATFFVRVEGDGMLNVQINNGDLLVVDRAITPTDNSVIIADFDGALMVRRLKKVGKRMFLESDTVEGEALEITDAMQFEVWGVVTFTIHSMSVR